MGQPTKPIKLLEQLSDQIHTKHYPCALKNLYIAGAPVYFVFFQGMNEICRAIANIGLGKKRTIFKKNPLAF
ncbi:MAG TPA: hypothetical protein DCX53_06300 [Anaerolineae bacterium]|nr:hypothetical protein [Anaerolineae bacterium]